MQLITKEEFSGTDRFLVQRLIGSGTFGIVYQVYDRENNTVIALKRLRDSLCEHNIEALYRFKQEFRSLADVNHSNLVTLYELISDGNQWFFTMELVEGVNFTTYIYGDSNQGLSNISSTTKAAKVTLEDSPTVTVTSSIPKETAPIDLSLLPSSLSVRNILSPQSIARLRNILRQLAIGIHSLHKAGKLHRDLKPSNVLVTPSGRVVILDFGLVVELSTFNSDNMEADLVGTPTHMSPEQAAGLPITEASDWYSFGVMLYQGLTGQLPFSGKLFEILSKKQVLDPIRPSQISENIPDDLDELCVALLQRDPNKRPNASEILQVLQDKHTTIVNHYFTPTANVFVGRENHLETLKEAFAETQKGMANIVCVYGISGMGKTLLVRHFLEQIQQLCPRTLILSGRCYEQESVPYKVFDSLIDSLAQYLKHLLPSELNALSVPDFLALTRLFPVLKSIPGVQNTYVKVLEIPDSQELRRRAFYALRELLTILAKRLPVILFVDDLQWGDIDSASLLEEIFCPPNPPTVMFIATYRNEKTTKNSFLQSLFALKKEPAIKVWDVEVSELSEKESYELASKLIGESQEILLSFADIISEESAGIPFFISELVQHIPISINNPLKTKTGELLSLGKPYAGTSSKHLQTTSLEKVIYERIAELPKHARQLVEIVAIAGKPILRQLAKKVAGLEQEELSAITTLRSQRLIRFRENFHQNEVEIYHDRIREAIVRHLSATDRQAYHLQLALELEKNENTDPEFLVVHFLQAGNQEKTAKYAFKAGEKAHQALAFEQAAHFYQIALNLLPKDTDSETLKDLNIKLATVLASAGRGAESAQVFMLASEYAESDEWLDLQRRAAEQYLVCGLINEGLLMFQTILGALGMHLADSPEEALNSIITKRKEIETRGFHFDEKAEKDLSATEKLQIDSCWSIVIGLTFIDTIRATEFQAYHMLFALQAGEPYRIARALCMEIGHRSSVGKASQPIVEELSKATEQILSKKHYPHALGLYKLVSASVAYFKGEWKTVYQLIKEAEKIFREECSNVPWEIDATKLYLFRALYFMGEIKEIAEDLPSMLKEVQDRGNLWVSALLYSRFYIVSLAQDLPQTAQDQLTEAISNWPQNNFYMQHYWKLFGNIEIALYCQDGVRAWHLINSSWAKLKDSMLLRVQVFFLESLYLHARSALTMAMFSENSNDFLLIAENDAEEIEKQDAAWALPLALLIRASIAKDQDKDKAISLLAKAEEQHLAANMMLYAFSACYRRGELTNDNTLIEKACDWMKNQTIVNPSKIVDMLIPGIWKNT